MTKIKPMNDKQIIQNKNRKIPIKLNLKLKIFGRLFL